jgi:hypothetical protein
MLATVIAFDARLRGPVRQVAAAHDLLDRLQANVATRPIDIE